MKQNPSNFPDMKTYIIYAQTANQTNIYRVRSQDSAKRIIRTALSYDWAVTVKVK